MWIKLLGMLLILFSGSAFAYRSVKLEKKKLEILDAWSELIFYIRSQIDCYLMPVQEILTHADPQLLQACMGHGNDDTLDQLLQSSDPYLNKEGRRLLTSFVQELGGSYREEQVKRCDFYADELRRLREKQQQELPAKLRVCITLSLSAALALVILLW